MKRNKRGNRIDLNECICIIRRPRSALIQYTKFNVSLNNDCDGLMVEKEKRECETWHA